MHNTLIKKWDICAPNAILNQVATKRRAAFTNLKNERIDYDDGQPLNRGGVFATIGQHHEQLLSRLRAAEPVD